MGLLKIELDVPEFNDSLEISMILKRDGKRIIMTESSCPENTSVKLPSDATNYPPPATTVSNVVTESSSKPTRKKKESSMPLPTSGNLMNIDMNF